MLSCECEYEWKWQRGEERRGESGKREGAAGTAAFLRRRATFPSGQSARTQKRNAPARYPTHRTKQQTDALFPRRSLALSLVCCFCLSKCALCWFSRCSWAEFVCLWPPLSLHSAAQQLPTPPLSTHPAMSTPAAAPAAAAGSTYAFNADIAQLMSLIINTFYSVRPADDAAAASKQAQACKHTQRDKHTQRQKETR